MKYEDLDCRQLQVVDAVLNSDAKTLVTGGPGTGKTTSALWSARSYLESSDEETRPRVLFLTFSRSALNQIMSRSPSVLACYGDRIEVITFHGLAFRLLRGFGRYAGNGREASNQYCGSGRPGPGRIHESG